MPDMQATPTTPEWAAMLPDQRTALIQLASLGNYIREECKDGAFVQVSDENLLIDKTDIVGALQENLREAVRLLQKVVVECHWAANGAPGLDTLASACLLVEEYGLQNSASTPCMDS